MTLYKVLDPGRLGAEAVWPKPGVWTEPVEALALCESGWHLATVAGLPEWVGPGRTVWEAEGDDPGPAAFGEQVFRRARLARRLGRLTREVCGRWAADCAEHVLPIWEAQYPDEDRPARAIAAARAVWDGAWTATQARAAAAGAPHALAAAAPAPAEAATPAADAAYAAYDAAYAAYATDAAYAAAFAAYAAAYAAAAAAYAATASASAADGAADAEREWQGSALLRRLPS